MTERELHFVSQDRHLVKIPEFVAWSESCVAASWGSAHSSLDSLHGSVGSHYSCCRTPTQMWTSSRSNYC